MLVSLEDTEFVAVCSLPDAGHFDRGEPAQDHVMSGLDTDGRVCRGGA